MLWRMKRGRRDAAGFVFLGHKDADRKSAPPRGGQCPPYQEVRGANPTQRSWRTRMSAPPEWCAEAHPTTPATPKWWAETARASEYGCPCHPSIKSSRRTTEVRRAPPYDTPTDAIGGLWRGTGLGEQVPRPFFFDLLNMTLQLSIFPSLTPISLAMSFHFIPISLNSLTRAWTSSGGQGNSSRREMKGTPSFWASSRRALQGLPLMPCCW